MEPGNLAACQYQALNRPPVARSSFETITQMDRTDLVLVCALQTFSPIAMILIWSGAPASIALTVASAVTSDAA